MKKQIRITICGLINSLNLGERFISDSLENIITDEYKKKYGNADELVIRQFNIQADKPEGDLIDSVYDFFWKAARHLKLQAARNLCYYLRHLFWMSFRRYRRKYYALFKNAFSDTDVIVIDGAGLLEYSYNEYQEILLLISEIAEELDLPVIYNAVGTVGEFHTDDYRCRLLMKAMRSSSIRYVSARDNADIVQEYVGDRIQVSQCADAAVLVSETYGIEKNPSACIGVGLIRGGALWSYRIDFDRENWIGLFVSIGEELMKRDYCFRFFSNGLPSDYSIGEEAIRRLSLPSEYLIERPEDPHVLAKTIASFSAMITCRMHSVIAGFSMGIPSVALSWNSKLDRFMELISCPERAISYEDFDAVYIVDQMEKAMAEGYDEDIMFQTKQLARESVRGYLDLIHD